MGGGANLGQRRGQSWAQNQVFSHFLKFVSLFFLQITDNDSLQLRITSRRDKTHKNIRAKTGQNRDRNQVFCHFLKVGSLVFLEITSKRDKIHQKKFGGPKFKPKGQKSRQKLGGFFCRFRKFGVILEIAYNDSLQQCITSRRGKTHKKNFGGPNLCKKQAKIRTETRFFAIF